MPLSLRAGDPCAFIIRKQLYQISGKRGIGYYLPPVQAYLREDFHHAVDHIPITLEVLVDLNPHTVGQQELQAD